jgi:hypothetical protein
VVQVRDRLTLLLGIVLLLVLYGMMGCSSSDSSADEPLQLHTTADGEHLRLATLHITGMS